MPLACDLEIVTQGLHGLWWPRVKERLRGLQERLRLAGDDTLWALLVELALRVPESLRNFRQRQRLAGRRYQAPVIGIQAPASKAG